MGGGPNRPMDSVHGFEPSGWHLCIPRIATIRNDRVSPGPAPRLTPVCRQIAIVEGIPMPNDYDIQAEVQKSIRAQRDAEFAAAHGGAILIDKLWKRLQPFQNDYDAY